MDAAVCVVVCVVGKVEEEGFFEGAGVGGRV